MRYGITYVATGGVLGGTLCAEMETYGYAKLFDTYMEAYTYLANSMPLQMLGGEVVADRHAEQAVKEVVEVFTGRRKIEGTRRPVVRPDRATVERVREILVRPPSVIVPPVSTGNSFPLMLATNSSSVERIRKQRT